MIAKDQTPIFTIKDDVATITLCRPSQHNRIAPEDCSIIVDYVNQAAAKAKVLVITGTGEKTFSSGYTLDAILDQLDDGFEDMLNVVENCSIPTICVLNGSVYGGATDLAMCCDFRIGLHGTRFLMPASRIGLHYYPDGIRRYVGMLGLSAAKQLFLAAKPIDSNAMLRVGFLTDLVSREDQPATLLSYIEHIMQCEPKVLRSMKQDLHDMAYGRANMETLRDNYEASLKSPELASRLATVTNKK